MKPSTRQNINKFLDCKTIAIAGASRDENSFSAKVAIHLTKLGYKLWYVNPEFGQHDEGNFRVQSVASLPLDVRNLLILTPTSQTGHVVKHAIEKGINNIWIQQKSETQAALDLAQQHDLNVIHHQCIFMFTDPKGIHKFHCTLKKVFGTLPQ